MCAVGILAGARRSLFCYLRGAALRGAESSALESDRNTRALLLLVSRRVSGIGRRTRLRRFTGLCDLSAAAGLGTLRSLSDALSLYESPQGKDRANFRLADVQGEG